MKSQNDLIISIVSVVLAIIIATTFFFTKREVVKPADPQPIVTADAKFTPGVVEMKNALPGASGSQGGPGGGGATVPEDNIKRGPGGMAAKKGTG